MIVVSDNGPIGFLVQIGMEDLLPRLYGRVIVPKAVLEEFSRAETPFEIRTWSKSLPDWLLGRSPAAGDSPPAPGSGERDAIQIAKEQGALLLCDDRPATSRARREGLLVTGTLGVLRDAHMHGYADIEEGIGLLAKKTDFRMPSASFLQTIVDKARELARAQRQNLEDEMDLDDGMDL